MTKVIAHPFLKVDHAAFVVHGMFNGANDGGARFLTDEGCPGCGRFDLVDLVFFHVGYHGAEKGGIFGDGS